MGARLQTATQAGRSLPRQYLAVGDDEKPHQGPKNPTAKRNPSTARVSGRALLTIDDIESAIAWRLAGIPDEEVGAIGAALWPLAKNFREDRPRVARVLADLRRPGDRRGGWSLACACLAREAERRGDLHRFAAAVAEVVTSLRQARRGKHFNRKQSPDADALDDLIADYRRECPGMSPSALFDCLARELPSGAVVEFDHDKDELVCQLDPEDEHLANIDRADFARRVRRGR